MIFIQYPSHRSGRRVTIVRYASLLLVPVNALERMRVPETPELENLGTGHESCKDNYGLVVVVALTESTR